MSIRSRCIAVDVETCGFGAMAPALDNARLAARIWVALMGKY